MKINKISLLDSASNTIVSYNLSNFVNIFYGLSGKGKTLLFNLICYALASSIEIDVNEAKNIFNDLMYIELTLENDFIIKRKLTDDEFSGTICSKNINDKATYRNSIEEKLDFKKIKLIKNKSYETITYRLMQFIDFLFFSEDKIASHDPLCKCGKSEKGTEKYNLLKYLVTGDIAQSDSVDVLKEEIKVSEKERDALKTIKSNITIPTKNYKIKRGKLISSIEKNEAKSSELLLKEKELTNNIAQDKISLIRLDALLKFNNTKIDDITLAQSFNDLFNDAKLVCNHCGEKISLINPHDYTEELALLSSESKDIQDNIEKLNNNIVALKKEREKIFIVYKNLEKEKESFKNELFKLDQNYYNYSLYLQVEKMFNQNTKTDSKEKVEIQEKEIATKFTNEMEDICSKVTQRLQNWGLAKYYVAKFDFESYDLTFSGTKRRLLAKGYKSLCTCAFIIELMLRFKAKGINYLNFVLLDSLWTSSDLEEIASDSLSNNIINDFKTLNLQTLVFENNPYDFASKNDEKIKSFNLNIR